MEQSQEKQQESNRPSKENIMESTSIPTIKSSPSHWELFARQVCQKRKLIGKGNQVKFGQEDEYSDYVCDLDKSPEIKSTLLNYFKNNFMLNNLSQDEQLMVIDLMSHFKVPSGHFIFQQGDPGKNFYIIEQGRVEVLVNGEKVAELVKGTCFGEIALMHNVQRTATIKAIEDTSLWGIEGNEFRNQIQQSKQRNLNERRQFVDIVPLFQKLTDEQKEKIASCLELKSYNKNELIVKQDDLGDEIYIIKEGQAQIIQHQTEVGILKKGDFFGDQSLLLNIPQTASVKCLENTKVLVMSRDYVNEMFGSGLQQTIHQNTIKNILQNSELLSNLNEDQVTQLIQKFIKIKQYSQGDIIVPQGEVQGEFIYLILKGKLDPLSEKCIGDDFLLTNEKKTYNQSYTANSQKVEVAHFSKDELKQCLGNAELEIAFKNNELIQILKKVSIFSNLSKQKLNRLAQAIKQQNFQANEVIVEQGKVGESLYIIKEGEVNVMKQNKKVLTMKKLDYFGERALILKQKRAATIITKTPTSI